MPIITTGMIKMPQKENVLNLQLTGPLYSLCWRAVRPLYLYVKTEFLIVEGRRLLRQ